METAVEVLRADDDLTDSGSSGGGEQGPEVADGLDVRVIKRVVGYGGEGRLNDDTWGFCWRLLDR